ncbi:hypothetical protein LCGC14_2683620, partial [marine sediment metagenome]
MRSRKVGRPSDALGELWIFGLGCRPEERERGSIDHPAGGILA